ncbi:MAG: hypothetical protein HY927_02010 [Elusimicrobia bacterium]|nr:hypothetical protein [Elusimicrobiota bacterium]
MSLATFSSILEFAIQREREGAAYFAASLPAAPPEHQDALARLKAEADKSLKALQTILRENVTEMVMEPFEPIDEAEHAFDSSGAALEASLRILAGQREFLRRGAGVVNLSEVKRALERIADKKNQLISEIQHATNR